MGENSKLADTLFARECAKRYPEISSIAVHAGIVAGTTPWDNFKSARVFAQVASAISNSLCSSVEQGARNELWAATCKKEELNNGQYYVPVGKASGGSWKASSTVRDAELWH